MSNIEHLVENGITQVEANVSYDEFLTDSLNKTMLKTVRTTKEELWAICHYIIYTHDVCFRMDIVEGLEKEYGYPVPKD